MNESEGKPDKILMNKDNEFYNRSIKSWLHDHDIEIHSTQRFIRTLKHKVYKYMISICKVVYIDKLAHIFNKSNSTYHSTMKMKPGDLSPSI